MLIEYSFVLRKIIGLVNKDQTSVFAIHNCKRYFSSTWVERYISVFKSKTTPRSISKQMKMPTTAQNPRTCKE